MKVLRVLIVDDEAPARAKLKRLLGAEVDFEIVGEASSGEVAIRHTASLAPDVLFLDVQMPGMSGFEVVGALTPPVPHIVFVTAHDAHAVKAFEVRAIDYLLKPVTPARFQATLTRLRESTLQPPHAPGVLRELRSLAVTLAPHAPYLQRILVHTATRAVFLGVDDIDWIEADRNEVHLHMGDRTVTERMTIGAIGARLDPAKFLRINRSQIVRLDAVKEMHPWSHGDYEVILKIGTRLMWSRRYRPGSEPMFKFR